MIEKRWRHHFPHYVNKGFLVPWMPEFWSNLPQNLMQPFPYPNDATHKIWSRLANWLQRYSSSKVWNFRHSRASNSKLSAWFGPKSNSTVCLTKTFSINTVLVVVCIVRESGSFRPLSRSPLNRFTHFPFRPESFRPRVVSPTFPFAPESFCPLPRSPLSRFAPL